MKTSALALFCALSAPAFAQSPDEAAFRSLYKELVETNTTLSEGDCTRAAQQVADRLKAAGFKDSELTIFTAPDHPKEGGLVAVLPGRDAKAKAILLLAHIDVVEAKRSDWERDPFKLVEENGYFYGRGTSDDKSQAAIWADTLIRLKREKPLKRTVKMALTCGEESSGAFNGAGWLAREKRDLIDAAFALNEGGGGRYGPDGKVQLMSVQVGEKHYTDYKLTVTNPGGHSSLPRPDNAIYHLAGALKAVEGLVFPVRLNPTTVTSLKTVGKGLPTPVGPAMLALAANPADASAAAIVSRDPMMNAMIRTTCVATQVSAGHAPNALPQSAVANVNCRIAPGETPEQTAAALKTAINDPAVHIEARADDKPLAKQPPMLPNVIGPMEKLTARYFPGLTLIPSMSTGATDAPYLAAVGIPTYGVPGVVLDADGGGIHGLNERIRVEALMTGRAFLYDLVKAYASE